MFLLPQFNAILQKGPCGTDPSSHPIFQQKLTTWAVSSRVRTGFCLSSMLFYLPPWVTALRIPSFPKLLIKCRSGFLLTCWMQPITLA